MHMHRRQIVSAGLVSAASALLGGPAAALEGTGILRPFGGSSTICLFASGLTVPCWEEMPPVLLRAIEAEFDRAESRHADSDEDEGRRAEFFAWLALRDFAPRALRRAGYHQLAEDLAGYVDLDAAGTAANLAGHEAKRREDDWLASAAYAACHHASCAVLNALSDETRFVPNAGQHAAWALLEAFEDSEDPDRRDPAAWPAAIGAINAAAAG